MHQTYSTFLDGMRRWISPLSFLQHCETEVLNIEIPLSKTNSNDERTYQGNVFLFICVLNI